MSVQAWLIFLGGTVLFFGYCLVVIVSGRGTSSARKEIVKTAIKKVFGSNRQIVFGTIIGMLMLNSFFSIFPADPRATPDSVSFSEEGRLITALVLFFVMNAAWYSVLVQTTKVIHVELKKL